MCGKERVRSRPKPATRRVLNDVGNRIPHAAVERAANSVKLNLQKIRGDRLRRNLRFWAEGGCGVRRMRRQSNRRAKFASPRSGI